MPTGLLKILLKLGILVLELLRSIYYELKKEENVDDKIKKRTSRLITNMREELTKISKPIDREAVSDEEKSDEETSE